MDETPFRARYEADAANKAKQPWKEHWDWVESFYKGKRFPPVAGWTDRQKDLLAKLPAADRPALEPVLTRVGQRLASEWAKDNSVRKVSTGDLQSWGKQFGDARDAKALSEALATVEGELAKRGVA